MNAHLQQLMTALDLERIKLVTISILSFVCISCGGLSKNSVGMEFVKVNAGEFMMGSMDSSWAQEKPVHKVVLTKDFWMGTTEVTQGQWLAVMDKMPAKCNEGSLALSGRFLGEKKPIVCVSWDDAQMFIGKLNAMNDGSVYRLPTEAEWEYACRAGSTATSSSVDSIAWYYPNSDKQTHDVATKQPNAWGLYDMQGNVWEWVQDEYDDQYYDKSPVNNPTGPDKPPSVKVGRGGSWGEQSDSVTCTRRYNSFFHWDRVIGLGFRVVREAK